MTCEQVRAQAAELALDVLPGDERAAVLAHLRSCPACQAVVDELAGSADRLRMALPEAEPPRGFAARAVGAMRADVAPVAPRRWHRPLLLAAAALLVLAALGALLLREGSPAPSGSVAFAAALETPGGVGIGEVTLSAADPPWISMRLDRGEGTHAYTCVLDLDDGSTVAIGPLQITDGVGSWGRPLSVARARVRAARVVDAEGRTVAAAEVS